jgi:hypothetical protein
VSFDRAVDVAMTVGAISVVVALVVVVALGAPRIVASAIRLILATTT